MAGNRHSSEVPYQNYDKLKQTILVKRQRGKPELFVDPSFPPDLSSLTYVYIGDDRYERTKFARPLVGILWPLFPQNAKLIFFHLVKVLQFPHAVCVARKIGEIKYLKYILNHINET